MDWILFITVAAISFVGSIQIGVVNLAVIQTTLYRGFFTGILVALGGSIPELIYAFLALKCVVFIQENQFLVSWLNLLTIPFFLLIGLGYLFRKETNNMDDEYFYKHKKVDFFRGFLLGVLNPQLLPFWFFTFIFLSKSFSINDLSAKYAFVLGAGFGAFSILLLFAYLANRYNERIKNILNRFSVNRFVGCLFIFFALIQIIKTFA
jgi:threonine/homoserine/homoserine lactone efflux protein